MISDVIKSDIRVCWCGDRETTVKAKLVDDSSQVH
jgi:hypothetical protein